MAKLLTPANVRALLYGALNVASASGIVFANKAVFQTYGFHFTFALTEVHTIFTMVGMLAMARLGVFERKRLPVKSLLQLAAAYVGYIVLCNLSLKMNTVGFYQVMKIAVAPTVIAIDVVLFGRLPKPRIVMSVCVVCVGIFVATVTDSQMVSNVTGMLVGMCATLVTALYQTWAGSKQKELRASSMQLLQAYTPHASLLLGALVPMCENVGWSHKARTHDTLLGFPYNATAVTAIVISACLGLLVSLSTFLVIGATSSLTYNVVGHLKTVIILTGGCVFFGDSMPLKKLLGVSIAMCGIVWYTQLKLAAAEASGRSALPKMDAPQEPLLPLTASRSEDGSWRPANRGDDILLHKPMTVNSAFHKMHRTSNPSGY
uniref:Sugar phosphate transporter domain-containing protein n=1 Tax=Chlamydomonas euryale TaxID=1486919 RepID=A0A7R9VK55_9CHLO|mmetsp:Transcript_37768/g.111810  ORF Transcript_37768/g.111810 Transcript_37768/m.111810 type:complete len:375 (+) Transcript_37768:1736-2860(+)